MTPQINDRIELETKVTGTIKDARPQLSGLILFTVLMDDNPDPVHLFEDEFTVITPEDVANRFIALSNDDYSGHDMRQYFPAAMRHLVYWNDPELLAVCFRLVYDLGMVSGLRAMRKEAEKVGTRKLEDAKQWLLSTR